MLKLQKREIILAMALSLSSIAATSNAYALGATGTSADYGAAVTSGFADREISVTPATKWVNVTSGETVRFNVGGKQFTWHFETFNEQSFDISKIAPTGAHLDGIRVYVASDPLYRGS
jgi:hypothetical protein